jgi:hypothetical protein
MKSEKTRVRLKWFWREWAKPLLTIQEEQLLINGTPVGLAPVNAGAYDTQHLPNNAFFVAEHLADHLHPITVFVDKQPAMVLLTPGLK